MKRLQRQQASNCVEEQSLERLCAESCRTRDALQRRVPYTTATKSVSFVAITPSPAPAAQHVSPAHTMSKLFTKDDEELLTEPRWAKGVGWRKLTERGTLKVSSNNGGYLAIDGCTAGFCVACYEGTKEERKRLQQGKYALQAAFKVSPGGAFDGQAVCILFDMMKAGDLSGVCDFCSLQINTSSRTIRLESLVPGMAPRVLMAAENAELLLPHTWITVAIHYDSDSISLWIQDCCFGQDIKLRRNPAYISPSMSIYNGQVGVGVYGMTRIIVKCFRIFSIENPQEKGTGTQRSLSYFDKINSSVLQEDAPDEYEKYDSDLMHLVERELFWRSPGTSFKDIVGLSSAKSVLREAVLLPIHMPDILTGLLEPSKGVLLFGPPGTGKTMLASAAASVPGVSLFRCSPATLVSKWRGESEKMVRALFNVARARAPSVLFFDEADALCSHRGNSEEHEASKRFKAELLQQMDGLYQQGRASPRVHEFEAQPSQGSNDRWKSPHVVIIAATNSPWDLDEALRRRLEKRVLIPLPDHFTRKALLDHLLSQQQLDSTADLEEVARRTEGFSCADLRSLCREAAMQPVRRLLKEIPEDSIEQAINRSTFKPVLGAADFESALQATRPSVSADAVLRYAEWHATFGSG